jgi:putative adenylate-forming enzyme
MILNLFELIIFFIAYFSTKNNLRKFKTNEDLKRWQLKKISKLSTKLEKSPFYKSNLLNKNVFQLDIVEKKFWMENFDLINTKSIKKSDAEKIAIESEKNRNFDTTLNDVTVGLSTGTSGQRGIFLVSKKERIRWAGNILAKVLRRSLWTKTKIAFFLRANSNLYQSLGTTKNIEFIFFDLSKPIPELVKELTKLNPNILVAPAQILKLLAIYKKNNLIEIDPEQIISVAEVLWEHDKHFIEEIFNIRIDQIYQATEGFLAFTCTEGNLHLNEDLIYFEKEWLDDNNFVPIITDFSRITQPIVRYRLNDVLKISQKQICKCGSRFTMIDQIIGRSDDIIYGLKLHSDSYFRILPDFMTRLIINSSDEIMDFQVEQNNFQNLEIRLSLEDNQNFKSITSLLIENINQFCNSNEINAFDLDFRSFTRENDFTKKIQRIKRNFNLETI